VPYNPVLLSFGLITHDAAYLYTDEQKLDKDVRAHLGDVKVLPYSHIFDDLRVLDKENKVSTPGLSLSTTLTNYIYSGCGSTQPRAALHWLIVYKVGTP